MKDRSTLKPGDHDTRAFVGPAMQYDFMGATQFRLLTTLGLREDQSVLDVGCGSLRAGRLLLPYLMPGNYYGVEPNKWLIEDMIEEEIGSDYVCRRRPSFLYNENFDFSGFDRKFDYIVMQSILSHTGADLLELAIKNAIAVMHDTSMFVATIIHRTSGQAGLAEGENTSGWVYPQCVSYEPDWFSQTVQKQGAVCQELPWMHPRQTWWLVTLQKDCLVPGEHLVHLSGVVLNDKRFSQSQKLESS
ncbi:MAG: methyltransferase [Granulosicoccus sp.]